MRDDRYGQSEWRGDEGSHELLAERALGLGLDVGDEGGAIDDALSMIGGEDEALRLELAAAALMVAEVEASGVEAMPASVRSRVLGAVDDASASTESGRADVVGRIEAKPEIESGEGGGSGMFAALGWVAAAAAIGVAAILYTTGPGVAGVETPAERIAALEGMDATIVSEFGAWPDDEGAEGFDAGAANGRVVWNNERQEGYMVFSGLAVNDPSEMQYQLWIVVPGEEQANPIDGGVFDIAQADGEVIVPIDAALAVGTPVAFGVTAEKPGGVVVSEQRRRVLVAMAG